MAEKILIAAIGFLWGVIYCCLVEGFGYHLLLREFALWEPWRLLVSGTCGAAVLVLGVLLVVIVPLHRS